MSLEIVRFSGALAYDLIYPLHLAKLDTIAQESMKRATHNSSHVWIAYSEDKILALWGLIPPSLLSDMAYLWLFTTEHFTEHSLVCVRHSQRMIQEALREYPTIVGHGTVGAKRSLRWLRWLGAEFTDPQGDLLPFTIKAKASWPQDSAQSA